MAAARPDRCVACDRCGDGGGVVVDRLARPGAARRGARLLHARGRPRRPAAAALHHAGGPLAAAGDARGRRSALSRICCSPTRTSASSPITASIRSRSARAVAQLVTQRPHRLRRLDPHHAGGAAARAAQRAHASSPSCARWCARSRSSARFSKDEILALYLSLAPYGGNLEGVRAASLAYFGKEPRRLTLGEAALLVALPQSPEQRRPDRSPAAARNARATACSTASPRRALVPADEVARAKLEPVPRRAGRCRCWRRIRPTRWSPPRRSAACIASPSTRRCRRTSKTLRASAPARSGRHLGRHPRGRQRDRRGAARASARRTISTRAAPARST